MKHKVKHVHFVGIGGIGMSGIAEVLLNLGYDVSGSDLARERGHPAPAGLGATRLQRPRGRADRRRRRSRDLERGRGRQPGSAGRAREKNPGRAARADARRADAAEAGHRGRRHARQDDHDEPDRERARRRRARSDVRDRRAASKRSAPTRGWAPASSSSSKPTSPTRRSCICSRRSRSSPTSTPTTWRPTTTRSTSCGRRSSISCSTCRSTASRCCASTMPACARSRRASPKTVVTYGLAPEAQVRAVDVEARGGQMRFRAMCAANGAPALELAGHAESAGRAQRANALAAIAVGLEVGVPPEKIVDGARRVQRRGPALPALRRGRGWPTADASRSIDDYGHHPVEMAATLAAARGAFPGRRLLLAFQPHRYTRTRDCFEDFVEGALDGRRAGADRSLCRRAKRRSSPPTDGRSRGRCACRARSSRYSWRRSPSCPPRYARAARDGDVVLTMGAGSIGGVPAMLAKSEEKERDTVTSAA